MTNKQTNNAKHRTSGACLLVLRQLLLELLRLRLSQGQLGSDALDAPARIERQGASAVSAERTPRHTSRDAKCTCSSGARVQCTENGIGAMGPRVRVCACVLGGSDCVNTSERVCVRVHVRVHSGGVSECACSRLSVCARVKGACGMEAARTLAPPPPASRASGARSPAAPLRAPVAAALPTGPTPGVPPPRPVFSELHDTTQSSIGEGKAV